ncbi:hypothetical protein [Streptomyces bauhiniae]|uniref:hypothetical protein n=1 Tax=Streptomyces bauhiniae TaxID=2340725 RepID=UPI00365DF1E3
MAPQPLGPAAPGFVRRHAGNLIDRDARLWRAVAASVIAAEIALLIEQTMPDTVVAGIGMHAAFTCRKLITFSGLAVGTYIAFAAD